MAVTDGLLPGRLPVDVLERQRHLYELASCHCSVLPGSVRVVAPSHDSLGTGSGIGPLVGVARPGVLGRMPPGLDRSLHRIGRFDGYLVLPEPEDEPAVLLE